MIFNKLILKNFKPYCGDCEINLFDETKPTKNMTLNVGATGNGKTSVSEGISWCLFGEDYISDAQQYINDLAIEYAKKGGKKTVSMTAILEISVNNKNYRIVRECEYDIKDNRIMQMSTLNISSGGKPIKNPSEFLQTNIISYDLMRYFIFDAEDVLNLFEKNQESTIKDNINRIVGVEVFDRIITGLDKLKRVHQSAINEIGNFEDNSISKDLAECEKILEQKDSDIANLERQYVANSQQIASLFSGKAPTEQEKKISILIDKKSTVAQQIDELNTSFVSEKLRAQGKDLRMLDSLYLILLQKTIRNNLFEIQGKISRNEFQAALTLLKNILNHKKYQGIIFRESSLLLPDSLKIPIGDCDDAESLKFPDENQTRFGVFTILEAVEQDSKLIESKFKEFEQNYCKFYEALVENDSKITLIGKGKKANSSLHEKFRDYKRLTGENETITNNITKIQESKNPIYERKTNLEASKTYSDEQRRDKQDKENRISDINNIQAIVKSAKSTFMKDLLESINSYASHFLRATVTDSKRFHSIEVDEDYKFQLKSIQGKVLTGVQMNRGTIQVALLAFFFSLSDYLKKKIPFVIDNPLMRLDPWHERRLMDQLGKSQEQIILHLIPSKEYNQTSFGYLKPFINSQNWIKREVKYESYSISKVEPRLASQIIEFNFDKLQGA